MASQIGIVELLSYTPDMEDLVYKAYRQCQSKSCVSSDPAPRGAAETLLNKMAGSPHISPLEHGVFTFAIEGISRSLSHQLVRHRIASFAQQSQRFCGEGDEFDYIIPPSIANIPELADAYHDFMDLAHEVYQKYQAHGIPNEDARFVLPNAAETKIVMTMNCSSLKHFLRLRCCHRAQWEIRSIANQILAICQNIAPTIFANAGAACLSLGYCPEPEGMGCGKYPSRTHILEHYHQTKEGV